MNELLIVDIFFTLRSFSDWSTVNLFVGGHHLIKVLVDLSILSKWKFIWTIKQRLIYIWATFSTTTLSMFYRTLSLSSWRLSPGWFPSSLCRTFQSTGEVARTDLSSFYIFHWVIGIHWRRRCALSGPQISPLLSSWHSLCRLRKGGVKWTSSL